MGGKSDWRELKRAAFAGGSGSTKKFDTSLFGFVEAGKMLGGSGGLSARFRAADEFGYVIIEA